jgi:hypothetical protein
VRKNNPTQRRKDAKGAKKIDSGFLRKKGNLLDVLRAFAPSR